MAVPSGSLTPNDLAQIDAQLAATDQLLERNYPGDDGTRQPVHTVYVPADRFTPSFSADWGAQALTTAEAHGGLARLGHLLEGCAVGMGGEQQVHRVNSALWRGCGRTVARVPPSSTLVDALRVVN